MADRKSSSELPQHVAAQLSHLTSRPRVQSTLILSRKDGSIIQATGQLATAPSATNGNSPPSTDAVVTATAQDQESINDGLTDADAAGQAKPYKPSPAEMLAAHIYAFVSSAAALSTTLSRPSPRNSTEHRQDARIDQSNNDGGVEGGSTGQSNEETGTSTSEREGDDDLKLLRLRTKIHEIIIIPDPRFLLCVVHDVTG